MQLNYDDRLVLLQRNPPLDKFVVGPEKDKLRLTSDYGKNNLLVTPLRICELDMHTALQTKLVTITVERIGYCRKFRTMHTHTDKDVHREKDSLVLTTSI
jgi:hypothetical protein